MTIRIDGTNSAANPGITGSDTDTGLQFGTDEVNIVTGGSTAVTVDSSQRVGIGTASPAKNLDISSSSPALQFTDTTDSSYSQIDVYASDLYISADLGGTDSGQIIFRTNGENERLRILSGGGLTFNGDTAAANALDDYEEGTWTPIYVSSGASFTYATNTGGSYVKIGRLVFCRGTIRTTDISGGTASNSVNIGGLPFTVNNNTSTESGFSGLHVFSTGASSFGGDYPMSGQTLPNTTETTLYYRDTADTEFKTLTYDDLADGSNKNFIKFNIMYEV